MENETFYGDGHKQFSKLSSRVENYFRPAKSVLHRSFEISALHVKASAQKRINGSSALLFSVDEKLKASLRRFNRRSIRTDRSHRVYVRLSKTQNNVT